MTLPLDHPAHFHHAPSFAALRAELVREAEARRRTYPGQIDKGRMTAQDAAWQHGVLAAIVQDLAAVIAVAVPALPPSPYSWADKRSALTRELDQRRRFYPGWIAKGRLDEGQAASSRYTAARRARGSSRSSLGSARAISPAPARLCRYLAPLPFRRGRRASSCAGRRSCA